MRVVFVTGTGRSGSTLLANTLGSFPGALSAGEVRLLFERGLAQDGYCGCRRPVRECPVWSEALHRAFGFIPDEAQARRFHERLLRVTRTRRLPGLLAARGILQRSRSAEWLEWSERMTTLLEHAAAAAGATTVVDSSRLPAYGGLLASNPRLDVRVVHLVRDPRAVAWSWQRSTASHTVASFHEEMERFSSLKVSLMWLVANGAAPAMWRGEGQGRCTVRYEDFVVDPGAELDRVAAFTGLGERHPHLVDEEGLHLSTSHAVAGNPNRVRLGAVQLTVDDEWRSQMSAFDRAVVSAVTLPRRRSYRY